MKKQPAQLSFSFHRVGYLDKLLFTKHLAVMIQSGIPLAEAIATIKGQTKNEEFKKLLTNILRAVENGQSLEKALSQYKSIFGVLYINLIRIGEESGTLQKNLTYLSDQLKKDYALRKKVQGALMYPAIVLLIALMAGGAISIFVLPQLTDLFSSLDVKLPLSTKILLTFSQIMKSYGVIIIIAILLSIVWLRYIITTPRVKPYWDSLIVRVPPTAVFIQDFELSQICRNLGIMLKSGIPITTALETEYQATANSVYKRYLEQIKDGVEKGKTISEKLNESHFTFIPLIVNKMVAVGEKSGNLDETLSYLGEYFEDEVDNYSKNFSTLIEPVVLVLIGLVVAFVAFSIISPIYQLTSGIK